MRADDVARHHQFRDVFTLVDIAEVGLPVFRLTMEAVTTNFWSIPAIQEFVMCSMSLDEGDEAAIAGMPGLKVDLVEGAVNCLVSDGLACDEHNHRGPGYQEWTGTGLQRRRQPRLPSHGLSTRQSQPRPYADRFRWPRPQPRADPIAWRNTLPRALITTRRDVRNVRGGSCPPLLGRSLEHGGRSTDRGHSEQRTIRSHVCADLRCSQRGRPRQRDRNPHPACRRMIERALQFVADAPRTLRPCGSNGISP